MKEILFVVFVVATLCAIVFLILIKIYKVTKRTVRAIGETRALANNLVQSTRKLSERLERVEGVANRELFLSKKMSIDTYRQVMSGIEVDRLVGEGVIEHLRGWAISPDALLVILRHIIKEKPQIILELGSGSTTVAITSLIEKFKLDTKLISVDHLQKYLDQTRERVRYGKHVEYILAEIKGQNIAEIGKHVKWYDAEAILNHTGSRKVDLLVVDGPPETTSKKARLPALRALAGILAPDATIILDDYDRPDEQSAVADWLKFDAGTNPSVDSVETEKGLAVFRRSQKTK